MFPQTNNYALKLKLDYTYETNDRDIYEMCIKNSTDGLVGKFPTPDELWDKVFSDHNEWRDMFNSIPFEDVGGTKSARYYQEKQRILFTLATGTGKTFITFQIAWKLFHARWNIRRDGTRRPRILFLADRNILANQAFNAFNCLS